MRSCFGLGICGRICSKLQYRTVPTFALRHVSSKRLVDYSTNFRKIKSRLVQSHCIGRIIFLQLTKFYLSLIQNSLFMRILTSIFLVFFISISSWSQTTVVIRPHFNGHENHIERLDSTSASWFGNPYQYCDAIPDSLSPIIDYMAWTASGCPMFTRFLLQFADITDTGIIPAWSTITSAKLFLYGIPSTPTGDYGNSVYPGSPYLGSGTNEGWVYELSSPFNPMTCWNNQPSIYHTDSLEIPASTMQWGGDDTLDVTSMVSDMLTSGNYGFEFRMQVEVNYRERLFASSRYSDSTLHPMLVVTYVKGEGPSSVAEVDADQVFKMTPNPTADNLNVQFFETEVSNCNILVYNVLGQSVINLEQVCVAGVNRSQINVSSLAKGTYVMKITGPTFSKVATFEKK